MKDVEARLAALEAAGLNVDPGDLAWLVAVARAGGRLANAVHAARESWPMPVYPVQVALAHFDKVSDSACAAPERGEEERR